jgi:hypothetical protein
MGSPAAKNGSSPLVVVAMPPSPMSPSAARSASPSSVPVRSPALSSMAPRYEDSADGKAIGRHFDDPGVIVAAEVGVNRPYPLAGAARVEPHLPCSVAANDEERDVATPDVSEPDHALVGSLFRRPGAGGELQLQRVIERKQPVVRTRAAVADLGDEAPIRRRQRRPDLRLDRRHARLAQRRSQRVAVPARSEAAALGIMRGDMGEPCAQRRRVVGGIGKRAWRRRARAHAGHQLTTVTVTRRWCATVRCSHR